MLEQTHSIREDRATKLEIQILTATLYTNSAHPTTSEKKAKTSNSYVQIT